jgi:uncharacterized protein YbaR (Trm112 family)
MKLETAQFLRAPTTVAKIGGGAIYARRQRDFEGRLIEPATGDWYRIEDGIADLTLAQYRKHDGLRVIARKKGATAVLALSWCHSGISGLGMSHKAPYVDFRSLPMPYRPEYFANQDQSTRRDRRYSRRSPSRNALVIEKGAPRLIELATKIPGRKNLLRNDAASSRKLTGYTSSILELSTGSRACPQRLGDVLDPPHRYARQALAPAVELAIAPALRERCGPRRQRKSAATWFDHRSLVKLSDGNRQCAAAMPTSGTVR